MQQIPCYFNFFTIGHYFMKEKWIDEKVNRISQQYISVWCIDVLNDSVILN